MYKELIISAIIILTIFILDNLTQKYTDFAINEAIQDISQILETIKKNKIELSIITKETNQKYEKWLKQHKILAFYIEHNELEKVKTNYIGGKSLIEAGKYDDAIPELEKTKYILEHINEKYSLDWANIF